MGRGVGISRVFVFFFMGVTISLIEVFFASKLNSLSLAFKDCAKSV